MKRLLPLLLLAGCSTSTSSLYDEASHCLAAGSNCDAIWERIERREEMIERRRVKKQQCPIGAVCMTPEAFSHLLGQP